jgi:putative GTP pyrophosphokinase
LQISYLLAESKIQLVTPVEFRVKSWASIIDKCERLQLSLNKLEEMKDLIGFRIVLLFKRDEDRIRELIEKHFKIISFENAALRLSVDRFGYGSLRLVVEPKDEWLAVPTLKDFKGLRFELQIRTASQHIWAVVSHLLQYKLQQDVPMPITRSINRAAALLELVDLEFERVLSQREEYVSSLNKLSDDEQLNIDSLKKVLKEELPEANAKETNEDGFSILLNEIIHCGIKTTKDFRALLKKNYRKMMEADKERVENWPPAERKDSIAWDRYSKGVFYTHIGLTRQALQIEFKEKYRHLGKIKEV